MLKRERELVVEYGRKIFHEGLTAGTGGNLSVFSKERQLLAISPSGIPYDEITTDDVVILNLKGEVIKGHRKPSSEYHMHILAYKTYENTGAIIHTHGEFTTVVSCFRKGLPNIHYLTGFAGGNIKCAEYATFSTYELAENAIEAMGDQKAVLLANHGMLVRGKDMEEAFNIAEQTEFTAKIYVRAKAIGEPVILSDDEMTKALNKFKNYGQKRSKKRK